MVGLNVTPVQAVRNEQRIGIGVEDSSDVRLLSIVHTVSSLRVGGMEQVVLRMAVAQKEAGNRVGVLAIHGGPLESDLLNHGIRAEVLRSGRISRGLQAMRYFRSVQPDVVHAHNPTSLHYAILSKLVSRAAVVVTVHGEVHARRGSALEWFLTSSVAVVSKAALQSLQVRGAADKASVVHNGIALVEDSRQERETMRRDLGVRETLVGVIVARLSGLKGHATLLRSLERLRAEGVDLLLLIAGDGAQRDQLERQARELSLDDRTVRFLGARSDVDQLLRAADFFVLPSDTEGLPLSVLEAMAHGLPIVASNVGGIPELIEDDKQGLLIPPADPIALAAAIRRLADDPALRRRLGDAARARASGEFSLSTTMSNYDQLYRRAISG
jgi:glycosyltransferase involved in cell wall biosynthesis